MPERRLGLVIANTYYGDPKFQQLRSPGADAEVLARVLEDDRIGGFHITLLLDRTAGELGRAIQEFYQAARPDDLVVTHIGCHGVKDDDGNLYFACRDTEWDYLESTGVAASFVNRQMARSRCQRKVLLLDCCYSGSISAGLTARGDPGVDINQRFDSRGQVVITASNAIEYAFEGGRPTGEGVESVFTSGLIKGLANGAADRDGDGWVSTDELYVYVANAVREVTAKQSPRKWDIDVHGTILIARSPLGPRPQAGSGQPRQAPDQSNGIYDVVGRSVCNTWLEILGQQQNGGFPFDAVVVGAGMFGAYCAEKLYRHGTEAGLRILVLDAGSFLFPTHIQNLPERLGGRLGSPLYLRSREDGSGLHNVVWGMPWISNEVFPGLSYCIGGRSLFWGGWSPRLTAADLARWPQELATFLVGHGAGTPGAYDRTELEIGVAAEAAYITRHAFHDALVGALLEAIPGVASIASVAEAPLALDAGFPGPQLFPYDKFSSAAMLVDAVRRDAGTADDMKRRLFVVPRTDVLRLNVSGTAVSSIDVVSEGVRRSMAIPPSCAVILAAGTVETTRLALDSLGLGSMTFGAPRVGNLMVPMRSNITFRVKRTALGLEANPPPDQETTAFLVRGTSHSRQFHIEVSASAPGVANPEKNMWKQIPDVELQGQIWASLDPNWITVIFRTSGEMAGQQSLEPDPAASWITLSPETDEFGQRRAYVHLVTSASDAQLWFDMDTAAFQLAAALGKRPGDVEYWNRQIGAWQPAPPPVDPQTGGPWRDRLGSSHNEAGTLFAGAPGASFTDTNGKVHGITNAYVVGPAVFPSLGSANPTLTSLPLARRTAGAIVAAAITAPPESGFAPLSLTAADWRLVALAGSQPDMLRLGGVFETSGGYGLYFYTKEHFANFKLWLEWRETRIGDNSGVYVRTPGPGVADAINEAVAQGHQIQIDDVGAPDGASIHRTGAIYALQAPSSFPIQTEGRWNTYLIEANGSQINVTLNGTLINSYVSTRQARGYLALEVHDFPSRIQFRNLQVKKLP